VKSQDLDDLIDFVAVSPQNDLVMCSGISSNAFTLLDATSGRVIRRWLDGRYNRGITAWSADGMRLLMSYSDGTVDLWDLTSARTTNQFHTLLQIDTPLLTSSLSFADGHRYIATDHDVFPIPPQHRPPCAADDDMPPSPEILPRLRKDGWVWLVGGGKGERRVCWLPPAYRPAFPTFDINIATLSDSIRLVTDSGRLVVLDLKKWFDYESTHC